MRVKAPWVKHCYFMNEQHYIIPNLDTVVLGGTQQKGSWHMTISQQVRLGCLAYLHDHQSTGAPA